MQFLVIIEEGPTSYGVSAPDIEGCFAVGSTKSEALERFQEALQAHLSLLADEGEALPYPSFTHDYVEVPLPTVTRRTTKAS